MALNSLSPNEELILNVLSKFGPCNQSQLTELVSRTRAMSRPYISKVLKKLLFHGLIKARLSGNGHEKLYSVKDISKVQVQQIGPVQQKGGVIYPPKSMYGAMPELAKFERVNERPQVQAQRPQVQAQRPQVQAQRPQVQYNRPQTTYPIGQIFLQWEVRQDGLFCVTVEQASGKLVYTKVQ